MNSSLFLVSVMDEVKVCIICKRSDGRIVIVSEGAKKTLIKSSVARKDGKDAEIRKTNLVHVHSECRNAHTKPQLIKKAQSELKKKVRT